MRRDLGAAGRRRRSRLRPLGPAGAATLVGLVVAGSVALLLIGSPRAGDPSPAPTAPAGGAAAADTPATTSTAAAATDGTTGSGASSRRGSGHPVTFAFAGDSHFESQLRTALDADPTGVLDPIAPLLSAADLAVVNLETSVTERGTPADKEFTFRAPATAYVALAAAGVDAASLANNHGLDYGPESLDDALAGARALHFPVLGIGHDAREAYAPLRTVVHGQRIAVIAATQVLDGSLVGPWTATDDHGGLASAKEVDRLRAAVLEARATSDTVVVFLHWGVELDTCPTATQRSLADQLVEVGADIVVGGHAHRLQGAGYLGDAFVAYGLGNFVWYAAGGPSSETGVLYVTATGRDVESWAWWPARISGGVPRPLDGAAAATARSDFDALRGCTGLTDTPTSAPGARTG